MISISGTPGLAIQAAACALAFATIACAEEKVAAGLDTIVADVPDDLGDPAAPDPGTPDPGARDPVTTPDPPREDALPADDAPEDAIPADDAPDSGMAAVGSSCTSASTCPPGGSGEATCRLDWPEGYCLLTDCADHGHDCPGDAVESKCVNAPTPVCLALCSGGTGCRSGYACLAKPDAAGHGEATVCFPE